MGSLFGKKRAPGIRPRARTLNSAAMSRRDCRQEDGMKALALVDAPDHVCSRYRIKAFEPALTDAGWSLTVEGLAHGSLARWSQFRGAAAFDAVILQRKLLPRWQVYALRQH